MMRELVLSENVTNFSSFAFNLICSEVLLVNKLSYNLLRHLQFMGAVGRFVHPMSLLQQLKELLHWDSWVWWASQGEDLPQQHPIGPPEHTQQHTQWTQIRGRMAWNAQREVHVPQNNPWICSGKYWSSITFTPTKLRINSTFFLWGKVNSSSVILERKWANTPLNDRLPLQIHFELSWINTGLKMTCRLWTKRKNKWFMFFSKAAVQRPAAAIFTSDLRHFLPVCGSRSSLLLHYS